MIHQHQNNILRQAQKQQHQFKKQKGLLVQKIDLLETELKEYQQKDQQNKKINESIMKTFKQTQNKREHSNASHFKVITTKYNEQIRRNNQKYTQQISKLSQSLKQTQQKVQSMKLQMEKIKLNEQKKYTKIKKMYEENFQNAIKQKQIEIRQKIQQMQDKVRKAENMAHVYKQFLQKKRDSLRESQSNCQNTPTNHPLQKFISNSLTKIKNVQEKSKQSYLILTKNRQSLKILSNRIAKAMSQLKPQQNKNYKIYERINQHFKKLI